LRADAIALGYGPRFSPLGKTLPFFRNILPASGTILARSED